MNTDKAKMQAKQAVDQAEHSASADKARGHVNQWWARSRRRSAT